MTSIQDLEVGRSDQIFRNKDVHSFAWSDINVRVADRTTKEPLTILNSSSGSVSPGEVVALMGPSGSGKTTLLNVLANRSQSSWTGQIAVNGDSLTQNELRNISSYVEQEDALIGSLTVRETIDFAARLSSTGKDKAARYDIVSSLISSFGLSDQEHTIVGTPLRKGISGGQTRRLSVATQLVTSPKILFLDEPTSGLDSTASYEVMRFISTVAKEHRLIVIASVHQPSTATFELFDKLLLLSKGKTCYFGPVANVGPYFQEIAPLPSRMNPAEFLLDLVNTDFSRSDSESVSPELSTITDHWEASSEKEQTTHHSKEVRAEMHTPKASHRLRVDIPMILFHRNLIKSYRDFLAYGTRVCMYTGLAIMMGTVWLRLSYEQSSIQPFINALFFSGAFMSFMAVAYVPSIIEDLQCYKKEHANGLYGPLSFMIANFLIGLPWLLLITVIFSVIVYWLSNFRPDAAGFWLWVLWLFLDLLAAEGLVILLSVIFPIFVVALAATAFANGLWMSVGGFLVPMHTLNVFWKYVFHYIDYQSYVFQAMMVNQFKSTVYECAKTASGYYCMYPSDLESEGKIRGTAVLDEYSYAYSDEKFWEWFGIMIAIIVVYRILGYLVLLIKSWRR